MRIFCRSTGSKSNSNKERNLCNCDKNIICPLNAQCMRMNFVLKCQITSKENSYFYLGVTLTNFKLRQANHFNSFKDRIKMNNTSLNKFVWLVKDRNATFSIELEKMSTAVLYITGGKRCKLCIERKV